MGEGISVLYLIYNFQRSLEKNNNQEVHKNGF